jgi:hypothetical protein
LCAINELFWLYFISYWFYANVFLSFVSRIFYNRIDRKAMVFPEPDGAWTVKFFPLIPCGITSCCIYVGSRMFIDFKASTKSRETAKQSNPSIMKSYKNIYKSIYNENIIGPHLKKARRFGRIVFIYLGIISLIGWNAILTSLDYF